MATGNDHRQVCVSGSLAAACAESVFATVVDVKESILVAMFFIHFTNAGTEREHDITLKLDHYLELTRRMPHKIRTRGP